MLVRAASQGPMEKALRFLDGQIVDRSVPVMHEAVLIELPVLIAVGAKPVPRIVMPFVGKAHGNSGAVKGPELLDQTVVLLALPLARQELDDLFPSGYKFGAIAPDAVHGVRQRDPFRIARVPTIFSSTDLECRGLARKWGNQGWVRCSRHVRDSFLK